VVTATEPACSNACASASSDANPTAFRGGYTRFFSRKNAHITKKYDVPYDVLEGRLTRELNESWVFKAASAGCRRLLCEVRLRRELNERGLMFPDEHYLSILIILGVDRVFKAYS